MILISLEIQENQIISLLGPSGSGKTTLLNLILGYLKPNEGSIEIKNKPLIYEIGLHNAREFHLWRHNSF